MEPIVDELSKKYQDDIDFKIMDINSEGTSKYGVSYVPTFIFQKTDGEIKDKIVGSTGREALENKIIELKKD
ncbi:thioredoxin family protein [Candidatus Oleimmundimicrobium sp.]|uniref:thioredoxin family protein n=1 Tax=Candidatus Oleimmundimicrobium sp. TaxID=3060597 RepID=UPI002715F0E2|nr:thioredoxin family protein [Candidatus Oleimmundimicrobium sp.]MDO8886912.1 thioredoxin family protein [Candidatus Oleimmundimicrobium sp.]